MKEYDVKCPVCGTENRNLYLEETNGYMECEKCRSIIKTDYFEFYSWIIEKGNAADTAERNHADKRIRGRI